MSRDISTLAVTADDLGTLGVSILSAMQRLRAVAISDEACVWMQQVARNAAELCTRHGNRDLTDLAERLQCEADHLVVPL